MAQEPATAGVPFVPLAPGIDMPAIGYGIGTAWYKAKGDERTAALREAVIAALDCGFRHIDEAEMYENEATSGEAICAWLQRTSTPREQLWLTHKVISVDNPGIVATCKQSLARMGLDYFDLYLVHAPFYRGGTPFKKSLKEVWADMESLVDAGMVRSLGVSNWRVCDLEEIMETARIKPVCNQIEAHPYLQQTPLLQYCQAQGICVTAYGSQMPLTTEQLKGGPAEAVVVELAKKYDATEGQVLLRWSHQTGRIPITTTGKPERMAEYLKIFAFELSGDELEAISSAGSQRHFRRFWEEMDTLGQEPAAAA